MRWSLIDDDRQLYSGESWPDLEQAVRRIPVDAYWPNEICDLASPSGRLLSIGVAQARTLDNPTLTNDVACVNHQLAGGDPPYLTVVGNRDLDCDSGGVVVFRYKNGHWTEVLARNCVPVETMISIVKEFFSNDRLPDWIEWEEV